MVTCDDEFDADEDLIEQLQETLAIGLENLVDIGAEKGVSNVYADQLHEEFKLIVACSSDDAGAGTYSLLDVFDADVLAKAIHTQLNGRPLVALYRGNSNDVLVRICVSDVGYMHVLRDRLLQGVFCADLQRTLNSTPRRAEFEPLGQLTVSVDKSHFAEAYEDSILTLNELTSHQRDKLSECIEALSGGSAAAV
eukprot:COSAG05_NODE_10111_length_582_cov_1.494824_1_plen_194_part_11